MYDEPLEDFFVGLCFKMVDKLMELYLNKHPASLLKCTECMSFFLTCLMILTIMTGHVGLTIDELLL